MKLSYCSIVIGVLAITLSACGDCQSTAADADAFVRDASNQECSVDADCVVVSTRCSDMETTYCNQVALSRDASESEEWASIANELIACDSGCTVCLAELTPNCAAGYCRAPD